MTVALQHQIFSEDEPVIESPMLQAGSLRGKPGCIILLWDGDCDGNELAICGNAADDFMERWRMCPDQETRNHLMRYEIRKALAK